MNANVAPPAKRLVLFLDGTWNEDTDNTSVWRLRSLCAPVGSDGKAQIIFYDTGLGTHFGEKVRGGLYGFGIDEHIRHAYQWLVENWNEGDELFIFGFSRGAFTARCLAGLISICGIVRPGAPLGVGQLYTRYETVDRNHASLRRLQADREAGNLAHPTREENWLLRYSRRAEITMLGVWDSVAALDMPGFAKHDFLDPNLRQDMKHAFHALALDEHRNRFAPSLWTQSSLREGGPPIIRRPYTACEQRWFIGAHANVGGGYPSDLLPQLPLQWMMERAIGLGLGFRDQVLAEDGAFADPVVDSYEPFLRGVYKHLSPEHFRPVGEPPVERDGYLVATINETIDASVFERWRNDGSYRPANLASWAARHAIDPNTITAAVRADQPGAAFSHEDGTTVA